MKNENYDLRFFGSWSRDCMRVLKYMIDNWPKRQIFHTDDFTQVLGIKGKALGGVMSGFSKFLGKPLVVKFGVDGMLPRGSNKGFGPRQLWSLHPELDKDKIMQIKETLKSFRLDEGI